MVEDSRVKFHAVKKGIMGEMMIEITTGLEEGQDIVSLNLELAVLAGAENNPSRELELWFDEETETETNDYLEKHDLRKNGSGFTQKKSLQCISI